VILIMTTLVINPYVKYAFEVEFCFP